MRFHVQYSQYLFIYSIFDDFFTIIYSVLLYHIIYIQLLIHLPADASSPSSHRLVYDTPHFLIKIFNRMAKHLNKYRPITDSELLYVLEQRILRLSEEQVFEKVSNPAQVAKNMIFWRVFGSRRSCMPLDIVSKHRDVLWDDYKKFKIVGFIFLF